MPPTLCIMPASTHEIAIIAALSPVRLATYASAKGFSTNTNPLEVYVWNAMVSGAFFSALQVCEVVIRNAISEAIEYKFGHQWPWDQGFERTINKHWKLELQRARKGIPHGSTGKVVAELKFAFWCSMLTATHDQHIWNKHIRTVFRTLPFPLTVAGARTMLHDELDSLRLFRNRIAHHEPIFAYPLAKIQRNIFDLIQFRSPDTRAWLARWETMSGTIAARP